jgi:UDP-N-acetylglucosamine 2-epimerase
MKKKKICFVTGTRADYGLLSTLIKKIQLSNYFNVQTIVTGAHLTEEHGLTINEISNDGVDINAEVHMLLSSDSDVGIAKSLGLGIIGFADALSKLKPEKDFITNLKKKKSGLFYFYL